MAHPTGSRRMEFWGGISGTSGASYLSRSRTDDGDTGLPGTANLPIGHSDKSEDSVRSGGPRKEANRDRAPTGGEEPVGTQIGGPRRLTLFLPGGLEIDVGRLVGVGGEEFAGGDGQLDDVDRRGAARARRPGARGPPK